MGITKIKQMEVYKSKSEQRISNPLEALSSKDMYQIINLKGEYFSIEGKWVNKESKNNCILYAWEKEIAMKYFKEKKYPVKCVKIHSNS